MPDLAVRALWRPVRAAVVVKYSGQLAVALGVFNFVPIVASVALGDLWLTPIYVALSALLVGVGVTLARRDAPDDVRPNEAIVIPALSFIVAPLLYALPLIASGVAPMDAVFESVSGITTTGLSTLGSVDGRPPTLLLVRAWQQWIGGLGIVVFALALFVGSGLAARRLGEENLAPEAILSGTRARARRYLTVYVLLTLFGFGALWLAGLTPFQAAAHALAAISTGGFSTHDGSLAAFASWPSRCAVIGISLLGAISLSLYLPREGGSVRRAIRDPELRSLVILGLAVACFLVVSELLAGGRSAGEAIAELPLLAFSAQTTAGFTSVPIESLAPVSKLALIGSMVVGGDLGSTAGGIKLLRVLVLIRVLGMAIRRRSTPAHAVLSITLRGRRVEDVEAVTALSLALLFLAVIGVSWIPFVAYGYDPLDALFEVASATGTVGLSTGIAGPGLEAALKSVLCADMWLGRLEVIPLLVALHPATWRGVEESET